jgi:hypothetical protein
MRFSPKSEKEIAEDGLFQPGTYDFEIISAEDATSKNGNDMIKLGLKVFDQEGYHRLVTDYLLESIAYKLRHAAECCGMLSDYERGTLDASDFEGKAGQLKLKIKKDKEGNYPDQNAVTDYIVGDTPAKPTTTRAPVRQMAEVDDDIPF